MNFNEGEVSGKMRAHMRAYICELTGVEETAGLELSGIIRWLANLYEAAEVPPNSAIDLSGPRWGLLLRLMAEEHDGNCDGLTPTGLSRFQNVSKNTISSLLRGLEEQGLIQRAIDPVDKRIFRIQLTDHGRTMMQIAAPQRIIHLNRLASGLNEAEQSQLFSLLGKLIHSVVKESGIPVPTERHGFVHEK
jgi:DNA-binding MarR family transcriptional regulator